MRAAVMLANEGANVSLTSREMSRAEKSCADIKARFGVDIEPIEARDNDARGKVIADAHVVFSTGAAGAQLLNKDVITSYSIHYTKLYDTGANDRVEQYAAFCT